MTCEGGTQYHEGVCDADPDECGHWCCKIRYMRANGGLRLSNEATPNREGHYPFREIKQPSWEAGIATVERANGTRVPILKPGTNVPMRVKEYAERRHEVDAHLRRMHQSAEPLT